MTVYLIHLDRKMGKPQADNGYRSHAQHYLGSADDLAARLQAHRAGNGSRFMEVATERGIGWRCVRTWPGGRPEEKALKKLKNSPRLCPICNPDWHRHA